MSEYPLYDVPYLVREPNGSYMSKMRYEIELKNQAVVDDYFIARDKGLTAQEARKQVAKKLQMSSEQVYHSLVWYFQEAQRRHIIIPDL